jgi:TolB-like protein
MIHVRLFAPLFLALALLAPASGFAQTKTFAVTQFTVHGPDKYQYLKQGIQSMVVSRLSWPGKLQAMDTARVDAAQPAAPASEADAKALLAKLKADYIVYGSLTITGEEASLDMHVVDATGKAWPKTLQTKLANLVPSLEKTVKDMGAEVFQRSPSPSQASGGKAGGPKTPAPPNAAFVASQGEGGADKSYLNPNFRYARPDPVPGRLAQPGPAPCLVRHRRGRHQRRRQDRARGPGTATVEVFTHSQDQLVPLAKYDAPTNFLLLNINVFDLNGDGSAEIIVSARYVKEPRSFVLEFKNGKLEAKYQDIPLYLSVAPLPPDFTRALVASKPDVREVFTKASSWPASAATRPFWGARSNCPRTPTP